MDSPERPIAQHNKYIYFAYTYPSIHPYICTCTSNVAGPTLNLDNILLLNTELNICIKSESSYAVGIYNGKVFMLNINQFFFWYCNFWLFICCSSLYNLFYLNVHIFMFRQEAVRLIFIYTSELFVYIDGKLTNCKNKLKNVT